MNSGSKTGYIRLTSEDMNNLNYNNCFEMSIKAAYYLEDEQGNQVLDEYGNPIIVPARLAFSEFIIDTIFDTFVDDGKTRIFLPTAIKTLPNDFGPISVNSVQDYDNDGILDVDEINFDLFINGELPTYLECLEMMGNE